MSLLKEQLEKNRVFTAYQICIEHLFLQKSTTPNKKIPEIFFTICSYFLQKIR